MARASAGHTLFIADPFGPIVKASLRAAKARRAGIPEIFFRYAPKNPGRYPSGTPGLDNLPRFIGRSLSGA